MECRGIRMARKAKHPNFLISQQMPAVGAMGFVANHTSFNIDRKMLIYPWPPFVCVTFEADFILSLFQHPEIGASMGSMAVSTVHYSLRDFMMLWQGKLCHNLSVASIA
jgi:hypothetical protein